MADQIPLPPSVETLIKIICEEQSQPLPEATARQELAALGEKKSLRLLTDIKNSKITSSFDGFIIYLARRYCAPGSPGNFTSPSPEEVVLPNSVEELIVRICEEQSCPRLGMTARRKLAELGEQEALRLLGKIQRSTITKSFDGFVMYLAKTESHSAASPSRESVFSSPSTFSSLVTPAASLSSVNFYALDEVASLVQNHLTLSPATTSGQASGQTVLPSMYNRRPNEQALSSSTNVDKPNGQTLSPSINAGKPNEEAFLSPNDVWTPNIQACSPSNNVRKCNGQTSSPLLQALHELEFRKAFLILSYIGRNKLEDVISVGEIRSLAAAESMGVFENVIWNRFGYLYCEKKDRVKHLDWESGLRYYYHCYVYSDGSYSFKGPYLNKTATHLQKVLGDENVLIVKFYDLKTPSKSIDSSLYTGFNKVAEEGIFVGLRRFQFFVFKDGGKEEKKNSASGAIKSYYVNMDSFARFYENRTCSDMISVQKGRRIFMHVDTVSSISAYMARFSLILSKTITLEVNLDDPDVHVEVIEDIPCKGDDGLVIKDKDGKLLIHTDGTGFISEELALRCPRNCYQGSSLNDQFHERYLAIVQHENASISQYKPDLLQPPLLIQFRMFHKGRAVKGTVLVNKKLQGKRIQIRPSMIKVESDPKLSWAPAVNSFEIVSTSNRPRKPRLSRYLIALLNYGGVPRDFFMNILVNELCHAQNILSDAHAALKVAFSHGDMDDNFTVARMVLSGIPLHESYIQWRLPILGNEEKKSLKEGRLPIDDSFYVMGTADPTRSLKDDEVCIIHETGPIEGDVLVYRHPGVHFGDIHILKATYVEGLDDVVGTSKYGIFFPTTGPRSLADKMAGGDFDGDLYWVSKHPKLLKAFKQSEPWTPTMYSQPARTNTMPTSAEQLEHELFQLFLTTRFRPSMSIGQAAQSWLCYMDQLLSLSDEQKDEKLQLENKICRLVDIYYDALDAPKKGKNVLVPRRLIPRSYPHYLGRGEQYSYKSSSILGELFDKVDELKWEAPVVQVRKLQCFDVEVPLRCMVSWEDHYISYRSEMVEALKLGGELKNEATSNLIQKYKQILYEADELEKSPRAWEEVRFDALAIYHVVYNYAIQKEKASYCGFAWKVAGHALLKIFIGLKGEEPIPCLPSVLREILWRNVH